MLNAIAWLSVTQSGKILPKARARLRSIPSIIGGIIRELWRIARADSRLPPEAASLAPARDRGVNFTNERGPCDDAAKNHYQPQRRSDPEAQGVLVAGGDKLLPRAAGGGSRVDAIPVGPRWQEVPGFLRWDRHDRRGALQSEGNLEDQSAGRQAPAYVHALSQ